jgi:hypothetical protein
VCVCGVCGGGVCGVSLRMCGVCRAHCSERHSVSAIQNGTYRMSFRMTLTECHSEK